MILVLTKTSDEVRDEPDAAFNLITERLQKRVHFVKSSLQIIVDEWREACSKFAKLFVHTSQFFFAKVHVILKGFQFL